MAVIRQLGFRGLLVGLFLLAGLALLNGVAPAGAVSTTVVVSQVYGGGGNSGAPLTHDYIELFNLGTSPANLAGWSLQYASATGNFSTNNTDLTGTIPAGGYLLVQEATNAPVGSPLPAPDIIDPTPISMSASAGKVALVNTTTQLNCGGATACTSAQLATIVDLVGYGSTTTFFEGSGPTPAPSATIAVFRDDAGCTDTDQNDDDFASGAPAPRNSATALHSCVVSEQGPIVTTTTPADGAANVPADGNITVNFSEDVTPADSWFDIFCEVSGDHTAVVSGGPQSFILNPDTDFTASEDCTLTIVAAQVTDADTDDPPDAMEADYVFSFTIASSESIRIHDIQGAAHLSPFDGQAVVNVPGIVTAIRSNGFYMQDPAPDADDATSEGIFVFTSSPPSVAIGDDVRVSGAVDEFRAGGASGLVNLTITELVSPTVSIITRGNVLPATTVIGAGGRVPPTTVIDDDATGSVETSGSFDATTDGIDFYESLEGMLLQLSNAVAVGPRNDFGEIAVAADDGAGAGVRTTRGGIVISATDFNPERIILDDVIASTPVVDVGDHFTTAVVGVLDYSFGNFKLFVTAPLTAISSGLAQESAVAAVEGEIAVGTINVENLRPADGAEKFDALADIVVNNLKSPDILALEEVQDNNGATNDSVVDATLTYNTLIAAIQAASGPTYEFRQIDPVDDQDGGEPGGNIRVGFLFRTDRGIAFVDRAGGGSTTVTTVNDVAGAPQLSASPGRIDPTNAAFNNSRKPLAAEFTYNGQTLFLVANHFNSKGGDQPLFGHFQPPIRSSEAQRHQQAQIVNDFVDDILAIDSGAYVIVLGDLNDFDFSETLSILKGGVLTTLADGLPLAERYSYVFDGNSQMLDHILVSAGLLTNAAPQYDIVHVNSEFADQISDHEPQVVRLTLEVSDGDTDGDGVPDADDRCPALPGAPSDGGCVDPCTLTPTITGTNAANIILGTPGDDIIAALGGHDTIDGNGGNDLICGGDGLDRITTHAGNDVVNGGNGNDIIQAGEGRNVVWGGDGTDTITTGSADDIIDAGNGNDVVNAGNGNNDIDAGNGADQVTTGSGDDIIDAGDGNDVIQAGDGHNDINAGRGRDEVTTGSGDDSITGDDGNDTISAGDGANSVEAGDGRDDVVTGAGEDSVILGNGNDTAQAGAGDDHIFGGAGADMIDGGPDFDTCDAGPGNNQVTNCEA